MTDSRRDFIKKAAVAGLGLPIVGPALVQSPFKPGATGNCPVCIFSKHLQFLDYEDLADTVLETGLDGVDLGIEKSIEKVRPYGFKGGYMTEIWQTMSWMLSESGHQKVGLYTQNVLWSDSKVFQSYSEAGGNAIMYLLSERAMQIVKG
jgi:hypothetical protein